MSLIQPSKLSTTTDNASTSTAIKAPNPNTCNSFDFDTLKDIISEMVREHSGVNSSNSNNELDQSYNINQDQTLTGMDKIPDVVKSLREFSGQPGEYGSWKKSVERILSIYDSIKGTTKYYGILTVIRNKITGHADMALESYNTPLNWPKISKCLNLHYADKRYLGTLENQMTTLIQKNSSIPEFYQLVYQHFSLILNKLSSMDDMTQDSLNLLTRTYRDKALDTFIRGLKGDLPRLLSVKEPRDLPEALHLCLKLQNMDYRIQHSHGSQNNRSFQSVPVVPPRRNSFHPSPIPTSNFFPQWVSNPQQLRNPNFIRPTHFQHQFRPNYPPQQPFRPNQFQPRPNYFQSQTRPYSNNDRNFNKPEAMEVDPSLRTRMVNYQNRPQTQNFDIIRKS